MTWTTRTAESVLSGAAGLLLAVGLLVVVDTPGRILAVGGAGLLLGQAAGDLLRRPRLTAGPGGVDVRRLTGSVHLPWRHLRVRVQEHRRLGLRSRTLELDTAVGPEDEGHLVVLGRRDLGADPAEVARCLGQLDPTAR